jgi:hypothetical protein
VDFDLAVLKCCPSVEVVIKPVPEKGDDASRIQCFPFPDPSISSFGFLQRVEWSFPRPWQINYMNAYYSQESLSVLCHIMHLAPNLRYLSLTGETPWLQHELKAIISNFREQIQHLRVLRTYRVSDVLLEGIANWYLPNLTHIITDDTPLLLDIQAPHVRVLDILDCPGLPARGEDLRRALMSYPDLEELCYILGSFEVPQSSDMIPAPKIQCVRLLKRSSLTNPIILIGLTNRHLDWLCGPTLTFSQASHPPR